MAKKPGQPGPNPPWDPSCLGPLFDLADVGMFVHPENGLKILAINRFACQMFGCTPTEALRASPEAFMAGDTQSHPEQALRLIQQAARGEPASFDWHARSFSGKTFWVRVDLRALEIGRRRIVLALVRDISEERARQEALNESLIRHQAIVEAFDGLIYICSQDFRIEYMNPAFVSRTGRDGRGELCYRALHNRDQVCPWCVNDRVFRGETVRWEVQSPLDNRWFYVVNTPIYRSDGRMSKQAMILDITEQKKAVEDRLRMEADLQRSQKLESLGVLAGGMAHDFNNLLSVIIGRLDLLHIERNDESAFADSIAQARKASFRAADLCRQMLAYAGKGTVLAKPIDLRELIADVEGLLRASIPRTIRVNITATDPFPQIIGDPTQIQQVLLNLVLNGAEALAGNPGVITLSLGARDCGSDDLISPWFKESPPAGRYIFLEVSDSGPGIPAQILLKIFDPFFSTKFAGRGLGLSAVMGIVKAHQGTILVKSPPDQGATFTILLPVVPVAESPKPENDGEETPVGGGPKGIKAV
jgi:PAS domain S-box-containing protein